MAPETKFLSVKITPRLKFLGFGAVSTGIAFV
jgi:hypothetical protein